MGVQRAFRCQDKERAKQLLRVRPLGERSRAVLLSGAAVIEDSMFYGNGLQVHQMGAVGSRPKRSTVQAVRLPPRLTMHDAITVQLCRAEGDDAALVPRYQMHDHLNSVSMEIDGSGKIISREEFFSVWNHHPAGVQCQRWQEAVWFQR